MSEQEHTPHGASVAFREPAELEAPAATVRLEDLLATVRRHIWLVLGVATAAVAAAGYAAYVTGPGDTRGRKSGLGESRDGRGHCGGRGGRVAPRDV